MLCCVVGGHGVKFVSKNVEILSEIDLIFSGNVQMFSENA